MGLITFTLHVYDLTVISGGGGRVGGVTDEKAAKSATADGGCISTFVSVKPLDVFKETLWQIQACGNKKLCFWEYVRISQDMFVATKTAILSQNVIFSVTVWLFCLNHIRAQISHSLKQEIEPKETWSCNIKKMWISDSFCGLQKCTLPAFVRAVGLVIRNDSIKCIDLLKETTISVLTTRPLGATADVFLV